MTHSSGEENVMKQNIIQYQYLIYFIAHLRVKFLQCKNNNIKFTKYLHINRLMYITLKTIYMANITLITNFEPLYDYIR